MRGSAQVFAAAALLSTAFAAAAMAPTGNLLGDNLTVGVVRYSDDVEQIWADLQAALCAGSGVCFGVRLFDTYQQLQDAHFAGGGSGGGGAVSIAWNGPVAHVLSERRAAAQGDRLVSLGMRDSDVGFEALIVGTAPASGGGDTTGGVRGVIEAAAQAGRLVAGDADSPQAFIVPLYHARTELGADITASSVKVAESTPAAEGKHGDTAEGETVALQALLSGDADIGFVSRMMLDRLPPEDRARLHVLASAPFDHCQFGALESRLPKVAQAMFSSGLLAIDATEHADVLRREGVRESFVLPNADNKGYDVVRAAVDDLAAQIGGGHDGVGRSAKEL